jgi:hypothetical protein
MKLCLNGPGAANAPYDINASTCFSAAKIVPDATTGSVRIQSVAMPAPAGWVQWSHDPYPECALLNDAGLPSSPFASKLVLKSAKGQPLNMKADDENANVHYPIGGSGSPEDTWIENDAGLWKDTDGNPLHAHGAGMYVENGQYYLVGNGKMTYDRPYFNSYSISLYSSSDLGNWTLLSASILNKSAFTNSSFRSPLINPHGPVLFARPKLIKSPATGRYILWTGFMSSASGVCVASSATIAGNYELESCFLPNGHSDTCDLTVVPDQGEYYLIADTAQHSYNGVSRLDLEGTNLSDVDCLKVHCNGTSSCAMWSRKNTSGEAPAFFRDPRTGRPYLWNSHLAGWAPNPAMLYEGQTGSLCGIQFVENTRFKFQASNMNSIPACSRHFIGTLKVSNVCFYLLILDRHWPTIQALGQPFAQRHHSQFAKHLYSACHSRGRQHHAAIHGRSLVLGRLWMGRPTGTPASKYFANIELHLRRQWQRQQRDLCLAAALSQRIGAVRLVAAVAHPLAYRGPRVQNRRW